MAKMYEIKAKRKTKGETRGRRAVVAFRVYIAPPGLNKFAVELRANKYNKSDALIFTGIVQELEDAYKTGAKVGAHIWQALENFPILKKRLAEKRFIELVKEITLFDLWEQYTAANIGKWKGTTEENKERSRARFFSFPLFDEHTPAKEITRKEAQAFRDWLDVLIQEGIIAEATAAGYIRDAKACFNWAVDDELLEGNPFKTILKGSTTNKNRQYYIVYNDYLRLLDACPSQEWRVLVALARRLGFRVPSETNALEWEHVDFENACLTVTSSKTARYKGKGERVAPLFPDVMEELKALRKEQKEAGERSPFVLPFGARGENANLRTRFEKIIFRAGLEKWEKLFQNLRSSAATDILNEFGEIAEAEWVGHSPAIAKAHYLQITPETLERAKNWTAQ